MDDGGPSAPAVSMAAISPGVSAADWAEGMEDRRTNHQWLFRW